MWPTVSGFLHAVALVGTAKVTASEFAPVAVDWFLPSIVSPIITAATRQLDAGDYPGAEDTVEMNATSADHLLQAIATRESASRYPPSSRGSASKRSPKATARTAT